MDRFKFRIWDKVSKRYFFLELKFGDNGYHPSFIEKPVFEQCTGLKDKNGKLIYEGDIVIKDKQKFEVYYDDSLLGYYLMSNSVITVFTSNTELEVIGNIHENADLLGEE